MTTRWVVLIAFAALAATGCDGRRETREILNMPDMHFSPAIKAQEENPWSLNGGMMMPVEGTVPINWQPYTITNAEADELASKLENPLPQTEEVLRVGEKYYGIFCVACHGPQGAGLGTVIKANAGMPMPPSLYSEKLINEWTDGRMYHVIAMGQGNMPAYERIAPEKRWAIIHYVRSLQRAATPSEEELEMAEQFKLENPQYFRDEDEN